MKTKPFSSGNHSAKNHWLILSLTKALKSYGINYRLLSCRSLYVEPCYTQMENFPGGRVRLRPGFFAGVSTTEVPGATFNVQYLEVYSITHDGNGNFKESELKIFGINGQDLVKKLARYWFLHPTEIK